jgi:histidyl-tRNA synthetase
MSYADKLGVPYAVLLGEDEIAQGKCSLKDMRSGEQVICTAAEAAEIVKNSLFGQQLPLILE